MEPSIMNKYNVNMRMVHEWISPIRLRMSLSEKKDKVTLRKTGGSEMSRERVYWMFNTSILLSSEVERKYENIYKSIDHSFHVKVVRRKCLT